MRQLRLRDIGGIIVIDFIDMARAKNRDQVLKTLRKALDADKTKSYVMEVSPLGPGRDDAPERHRRCPRDPHPDLPDLRRRGRVPSAETMAIEVIRRLRELAADQSPSRRRS